MFVKVHDEDVSADYGCEGYPIPEPEEVGVGARRVGVGAIVRLGELQWRFEVIGWTKTGDNSRYGVTNRSCGKRVGVAVPHDETPREVADGDPEQSLTEGNDEAS